MSKNKIFSLLTALLILAGCDYNDKYFDGYDDIAITDLVQYEGPFTGKYPSVGYFTDKASVESAVNTMMKGIYKYCDKGSTAKVSNILYGDVVTGFSTEGFTPTYSYTMVADDYIAMGTASGQPGRYKNFDANMDINHYISIMLKGKYPYAMNNVTASVTYTYYASSVTTNPSRAYKYDGIKWNYLNPASSTEVTEKIAEMTYDGTNWKLKRMLGGTAKFKMAEADYRKVVDWVKATKAAEYMSTANSDEEYYTGCSAKYFNINNNYNTWRNYYNKDKNYPTDNTEMQIIMDARIAEAIIDVLLPAWVSIPDPGVAYVITYKVYAGRGDGFYHQTFMYNEDTKKYEVTEGVVKE